MDATTIRDGMVVYSADGNRLGKIVRYDDDTLIVEKGLLFKKDYAIGYNDVAQVNEDEVWLRVNEADIEADRIDEEDSDEAPVGRRAPAGAEAGMNASDGAGDEVVMVVEEEVVVARPVIVEADARGTPPADPGARDRRR